MRCGNAISGGDFEKGSFCTGRRGGIMLCLWYVGRLR